MRCAALLSAVLVCSWQDEKSDAATKAKAKERFAQLLREAGALHKKAEGDAKFRESAEFEKRSKQIGGELVELAGTLGARDPDAIEALVEDIVRTHVPELVPELDRQKAQLLVTANEYEAFRALRAIAQVQDDMCLIDMDENGTHDYWVADVSGLNRMKPGEKVLQLISTSIARADAKPCVPLADMAIFKAKPEKQSVLLVAAGKPAPHRGYYFAAVPQYEVEGGETRKYDDGSGRNKDGFAFCAYPAEYPKTGKLTFIIDHRKGVHSKGTAGKPADTWPLDPAKSGWSRRR